jgi:hypothetical protein
MRRALSKAHDSRTHETRMRTLRAVLPPGWTFTPEHTEPSTLAAFAAALNLPDGGLGIDAPFSLSATARSWVSRAGNRCAARSPGNWRPNDSNLYMERW